MKAIIQSLEINAPTNSERFILRALIICGTISVISFCVFLFRKECMGFLPLFVLLGI